MAAKTKQKSEEIIIEGAEMHNLKNIRQGKHFEIEVNENDQVSAKKKIDEMCKKLLVNLIIEDYKISKI